jgi:hypothetical protein
MIDLKELSKTERQQLLLELQADDSALRKRQRDAYEALRKDFLTGIFDLVFLQEEGVKQFHTTLVSEVEGFRSVMADYGHITTEQMSFTINSDDLRLEVKSNKVKRFDERADMAAVRLMAFLKGWVKSRDKGTDDPMYQLAMLSIERNQKGDLDYKQISNLYKLEEQFGDAEYTDIMKLFRESHIIDGTAINFYFYKKTENQVWKRIEISFNRL